MTVGQFGSLSPIGAEQTASGYEVAWKAAGIDQYIVWNTDANGNYVSDTGALSGTSLVLEAAEVSFHQDLNGDGRIGIAPTTIEAFGSTKLDLAGSAYSLDPVSGGAGPSLKYHGVAVLPGQFGALAPIGAEQTASGYEVAWKAAGIDQYIVWNTDANGNYVSDTGALSGTSLVLEAAEVSFHQDLNGDGRIGIAPTTIEAFGSTRLDLAGSAYSLDPVSGGAGPSLKYHGVAVLPGQFGALAPIGAEQTASGYEVAWKAAGIDQYIVWNTDANGNYVSDTGALSGTSIGARSGGGQLSPGPQWRWQDRHCTYHDRSVWFDQAGSGRECLHPRSGHRRHRSFLEVSRGGRRSRSVRFVLAYRRGANGQWLRSRLEGRRRRSVFNLDH